MAIPLLAQAKDPINYTFVFGHTDGTTTTVSGVTNDKTVFIAEAGGNDKDNPIGMEMHLSCSDEFPGGWGEKDGPDPVSRQRVEGPLLLHPEGRQDLRDPHSPGTAVDRSREGHQRRRRR